MNLELSAMHWLWIEKNCQVVLEQRSPRYGLGDPDVLGVTKDRHLIEIEIKRSAGDFRADFKKPHRINQALNSQTLPRQFYYLMPKDLAEKLKDQIPSHAGLMQCKFDCGDIEVVKVAPVNRAAPKLNIKEVIRLARQMAAHTMGYAWKLHRFKSEFEGGRLFEDYFVAVEDGRYQI